MSKRKKKKKVVVPVLHAVDPEVPVPVNTIQPVSREPARLFQHLVLVYDLVMPDGRVYRWDSREEAERFALVHQIRRVKYEAIDASVLPIVVKALQHARPLGWENSQPLRKQVLRQAHQVWVEEED